jgi:hypothetical protein
MPDSARLSPKYDEGVFGGIIESFQKLFSSEVTIELVSDRAKVSDLGARDAYSSTCSSPACLEFPTMR